MGQPGGAIVYGALGAAMWGTRVGCVSLAGTDYPVGMLDALEERGADLTGVHRLRGPGVRTWLLYEGHLRRLIHRLGCPTHEEVSPGPEHIPSAWTDAGASTGLTYERIGDTPSPQHGSAHPRVRRC